MNKVGIIILYVLFFVPLTSISFGDTGNFLVESYNVDYTIDNGIVNSIFLDPDFLELIVMFQSQDDGTIEITIPRQLLDAKFESADDIFFVLVDGFETDYIELSSDSNSRTLIIPYFMGDSTIEIIGTSALTPENNIEIPSWIKNNAGWWASAQIDDETFVQGIQFLIQKGIMNIPSTQLGPSSSQEIPSWIKNNAGWWAEGLIEDSDFVSGIQFLISNGIMKV